MTWAMETSLYPSFDFSFQSSLDLIDFEKTHFLPQPCFEEIHDCSRLDDISAFETENHSLHTIVEDSLLDDGCMDTFMFMQEDLNTSPNLYMGFSVIQDPMASLEQSVSKEIGCELNQSHENWALVEEQHNVEPCDLKDIQEELEETNLVYLLLKGAEAVEAENWQLASTIIVRLNYLISDKDNAENPFYRLAFFFTQGLHYKSIKAEEPIECHADNNIAAFQMLLELSPYIKFAHFTANQAILEATTGESEVHILDFNVMEGIQWPPLMVDLAPRKNASLRLTAIIDKQLDLQCDSIKQTGRRLREFADSINLDFRFDELLMEKEEDMEGIEVGKALIVNCMIHQLHMPNKSFRLVKDFLGGVRKLSPKMVVLIEEELFNFAKMPSKSFVQFFCDALYHYSALSDSLLSSFCGGSNVGLRVIEQEFLGVRIMDCLQWFPCESMKMCRNDFLLQGFKAIPLSSFNVSQAKLLVGIFSGGYGVQHENCRLDLCWKSTPLITTSIWIPS